MIDESLVRTIIDNEIKPYLQSHGGDIELVEITENNVVRVRLKGGCSHCPGAKATLANLVGNTLRQAIPEIESVESV